jgi:RNA polymerase sigma factor (sigma-70 family)
MDVRLGDEHRGERPIDAIVEENWAAVQAVCRMRLSGIRSADVDDAVQDTFVAFLLADRTRILDERAWLIAVAIRMCGHIHRRRYRLAEVPIVADRSDESCDPCELAVDQLAFLRLIASLPAVEQQLIAGRYVDRLSYEQLGKRLGVTEGHARILAFRARHRIRNALKSDSDDLHFAM